MKVLVRHAWPPVSVRLAVRWACALTLLAICVRVGGVVHSCVCMCIIGACVRGHCVRAGMDAELDAESLKKLRDFFEPHNREFYKLVGIDFGWEQEIDERLAELEQQRSEL